MQLIHELDTLDVSLMTPVMLAHREVWIVVELG